MGGKILGEHLGYVSHKASHAEPLSKFRVLFWFEGRFASIYCSLTMLPLYDSSEGSMHSAVLFSILLGWRLRAERAAIALPL